VVVRKRWAWLEGNVEWNHQRARMENAVRRVAGVRGVTNLLALRPRVAPVAIKNKIVEALRRQAAFDADRITVETSGSEVLLKGTVRSWAERQEAERVAWRAPGVTNVDNRLAIAS
jgi:osmotically-inducible protein OsmY